MGKSKKPKVEVNFYYMSEHFGICTGPPDALLAITINEKQAWAGEQTSLGAISINKRELFGGDQKEGGAIGLVHYLPGDSDQVLPDALAQRLGRANGADCPGFRGLASLFFYRESETRGFYWTANTPYLPGVWATVRRILKRSDGSEQWYPEKAKILSGYVITEDATDIQFVGQQQVDRGAGTGPVAFSLSDGTDSTPQAGDFVIIVVSSNRYPFETASYHAAIEGYDPLTDIYTAESLGSDMTWRAYCKFMGDTPDTTFTPADVEYSGASNAIQVMVFRGVDPGILASTIERVSGTGPASYSPADIVIGGEPFDPGDIGGTVVSSHYVFDSFALLSATGAQALPIVLGGQGTGGGAAESVGNLLAIYQFDAHGTRSSRVHALYGNPVHLSVGADMNPAHIIRECLTDIVWGMGTPTAGLDDAAFTDAADTLFAEGFGLSLIWTRQTAIEDFIQEVLDHIQAVLYVDPSTGLLTLKLIRGDYDESSLPVIDPDNADLTNFSRKLWGDIVNEIVVTWTNPENEQEETITAQDLASIATQGGVVSDSRNYYGVRNANLAQTLAFRDLRSAGQPLAACEAEVDRSQWRVRPASVVKLTWPEYGLSELVMRVTSVDYGKPGDPTIKLSLMEDVYGLDIGAYEAPPSTMWEDPSTAPVPLDTVEIFTLPLFMAADTTVAAFVDSPEYPEVLAGVLANDDSGDTFAYELWDETTLPNGSTEWESLGTNNIIGCAELPNALDAEADSVGVDFGTITGQTAPTVGGFAIIGNDGEAGNEIALIEAVDDVYGVDLTRGVLDTVPRAWPAGTPVWFVDGSTLFEDPVVRAAGEVVDYKLLTRTSLGLLDIDAAPVESATLSERPWLPNRPANITAYGEAWSSEADPIDARARPDAWVTVTWANRNRLTEDSQVLSWTDADVTPEDGQTTAIEVRAADGTLLATHDGLTGTSFDVPDASFGGEEIVRLRVMAERSDDDGEFVSLQYFEHWVQVETLTADSTRVTADSTTWTVDEG